MVAGRIQKIKEMGEVMVMGDTLRVPLFGRDAPLYAVSYPFVTP